MSKNSKKGGKAETRTNRAALEIIKTADQKAKEKKAEVTTAEVKAAQATVEKVLGVTQSPPAAEPMATMAQADDPSPTPTERSETKPEKKAKKERKPKEPKAPKAPRDGLSKSLVSAAVAQGISVTEQTGWFKLTGPAKKRFVYVAKRGSAVNLAGFTVEHAAVAQISAEEAKRRHLGNVRGQIVFHTATLIDDAAGAAFGLALAELKKAEG